MLPKPLKRGDTIALIAPASPMKADDALETAVSRIEARGFRAKPMPGAGDRYGYLAGTDEVRAAAVEQAFADDDVNAVFCLRGGYGTARILDRLDLSAISRKPKIFAGYSDITALHAVFNMRCDFPTFHAPMPTGKVFEPDDLFEMITGGALPSFEGLTPLNPGTSRGIITGGNLSLIAGLLGTPYETDTCGKILFIEDIGEKPYRLDAMLTHLRLAGKFDDCAGIVFGQFTQCEAEYPEYSLTIDEIIRDVVLPCGKPVVTGLYCGHVDNSVSLPLGIECVLNASEGKLTYPGGLFRKQ